MFYLIEKQVIMGLIVFYGNIRILP